MIWFLWLLIGFAGGFMAAIFALYLFLYLWININHEEDFYQ